MTSTQVAAATCAAIFALWWVLSALHQIDSGRWTRHVRRRIPLGLLPGWTFFAPNPGSNDVRLLWRAGTSGEMGDWHELVVGYPSPIRRWLWNPELILHKAVIDLCNNMSVTDDGDCADRSVMLGASYLVLLNTVGHQVTDPTATHVQFAIARTSGERADRTLDVSFLSETHGVTGTFPAAGATRVHAS